MISAILLNWERRANLERICAQLEEEERVGEVIVGNNNPEVRVELGGDGGAGKAHVVNCSEDFGLFTRFAAASFGYSPQSRRG